MCIRDSLDAFLVVFGHLAVHLAAVAAVDVGKHGDGIFDRPFGPENDHVIFADRLDGLAAQFAAPVIIYGAGEAGAQLVNALRYSTEFEPVAFVDDNPCLLYTSRCV